MKNLSKIKKDTFVYGLAMILERFISFLMLPILTKNLSVELYGVWSQIIITLGFLIPVVLLGFQTAMVNFFSSTGSGNDMKNRFFNWMLNIVLLNSMVIVILSFLYAPTVGSLMFGNEQYVRFVLLFSLLLVTEVGFEMLVAYLRSCQNISLISIYYIIKGIMRLFIVAVFLAMLNLGLYITLVLLIASQAVFIVVIYVKDIYRGVTTGMGIATSGIKMKDIFFFSLPLIPSAILTWINNFADRYFILHLQDINQVSIYSAAYSIAGIIGVFYSILGFTLYPELARIWDTGNKIAVAGLIEQSLKYYLFFIIPSALALTIFGAPILTVFTTADYVSNWQVVFWLSLGISFFGLYSIYVYIALLAKKTNKILFIVGVSALVNVVLNSFLVPAIGILGAAISTTISNAVMAFWTMAISRQNIYGVFPLSDTFVIARNACIMAIFLMAVRHYVQVNTVFTLLTFLSVAGVIYITADFLSKNSVVRQLKESL